MKTLNDRGLIHQVFIIKGLFGDEETARTSADTALGNRIGDEETARTNADTALGDRIDDLQDLVSLIPKFGVSVVQNLPTQDISDTTIYLVPSNGETGNLYTEYIWVDDKWEMLGTQTVMGLEPMSQATASEGTSTNAYSISAKVLHDTIEEGIQNNGMTLAQATEGESTDAQSISAKVLHDTVDGRINDTFKVNVNITQSEHQTIEASPHFSTYSTASSSCYAVKCFVLKNGQKVEPPFKCYESFEILEAVVVKVWIDADSGYQAGEPVVSGDIPSLRFVENGYQCFCVLFGGTLDISATPAHLTEP